MLGNAISGLLGAQSALNTTSHNIANVSTEGFTRQSVSFSSRNPIFEGGSFFGTGVEISDVRRIIDAVANVELLNNNSAFNQFNSFSALAGQIDSFLADPSAGASPAIQSFFDSMNALTNDPASVGQREVVFNQIQILSTRFNTLSSQLDSIASRVEAEIQGISLQVSTIASSLADLNRNIIAVNDAAEPNDLLDQRERLLKDLSELIDITTFDQADGSVSVFIGTGQSLVIGAQFNQLVTTPNARDPKVNDLLLVNGGTQINISSSVTGGKLGGLKDFRDNMLSQSYNRLGKVAMAIADNFNSQNQLGMDINDQLGSRLFNDINDVQVQQARVLPNANNAGNLDMQLVITDVNQLTDDDYRLDFNAGIITLRNARTNAVITSTPLAPGPFPVTTGTVAGLGFAITFNSGAPVDGDNYLFRPTKSGASELSRGVSDLRQIAAASPIRISDSNANLGTGSVVSSLVTDTTNAAFTTTPAQLTPPVRIQFTSATTYDIINNTTSAVIEAGLVFTPNNQNTVIPTGVTDFGYQVVVEGSPQVGDSFIIDYNNGGVGDNRNAILFSNLQTASTLDGGTASFQQGYGQLVTRVGSQTQEASIRKEASLSALRQSQSKRDSVSGVNLDEEAANLIAFQQAFEASARVISVANTLFDSLIAAVRT